MPFLVIPYPHIDPVLVHIGPFAIRWYALAYIFGILIGWAYARAIVRSGGLWGGKSPLSVTDFDDFVLWVTLGIILGGRIGYVLFYNLPFFAAHPLQIFELWTGGMSFHGGFTGCVVAVVLFARSRGIPILSLGDVTCAVGPIGLFLGRLANFVNGELWGRPTDVPWAMIFPGGGPIPRHPSQLYEASLEGLALLAFLALMIRLGALKRPGLIIGCLRGVLRLRPLVLRVLPRTGRAARLPVGRRDHGTVAVDPAVPRRPRLHRLCDEASAAAEELMPSPLEREIRARIAAHGPMPVADYMALCLADPRHGYYVTRDPFGARGDFITAPEVSQMFGELIGVWMAAVWRQMGAPAARPIGRARSRPRHADERRAARGSR